MDWAWLQNLFGGGAAPSAAVVDPLDIPLDQQAQAKLAGGSPYEQDQMAQVLRGLQKPAGGLDKTMGRLGQMGEKMVLNGLAQPPAQQMPARPPMPTGAQLRGGQQPLVGTGAGLIPRTPEQKAQDEKARGGRYLFTPSLY